MKLTILGTGNAAATRCYNSCFSLSENRRTFLVDAGGGNGILAQLGKAEIALSEIDDIFVTHKHIDHILGVVWLIRMMAHHMNQGSIAHDVTIYSHKEVLKALRNMSTTLLQANEWKRLDDRIRLTEVEDGSKKTILGREVAFFDILSTKARQFGFTMRLEAGTKLTCCGDEPYHEACFEYVQGSEWLLHEAFCLYSEEKERGAYKKHHSTVKDACETAERLQIKNLILYHTEDDHLSERKRRYGAEGADFFHGNLYIPDDLESFEV